MTGRASATANPNIALIKYWGKADEKLILPATGSISLTLDIYPTSTTVELDSDLTADEILLSGSPMKAAAAIRVREFLDTIRRLAGKSSYAKVHSENDGPIAAGLASSASGFAALTVAAASAYGLDLDATELSRLARRGSGSACRSIFGGLVEWKVGDDLNSYAAELPKNDLELALIIAELHRTEKPISSREAMQRTVATSPFYPAWVSANGQDLITMRNAIAQADYKTVGELTELSSYRMHATMLAANPAIKYLSPDSVRVLDVVKTIRAAGLEIYATMDAGPNVKILSRQSDQAEALRALSYHLPGVELLPAKSGLGARLID